MRKIFCILFLFFIIFSKVSAENNLKIISREEWGANENYTYRDSKEWINIIEKRKQIALDKEEGDIINEKLKGIKSLDLQKIILAKNNKNITLNNTDEKAKEIDSIMKTEFSEELKEKSTIYKKNGRILAWPIKKAEKIKGFIIHHTYKEYESSLEGVRDIYKYHSITRQWGDIGYNYLIGKNGEIYEGRAGGNYVVGAHTKGNNYSTVGIAIIGDYSNKPINKKQYNSLKKLIKTLSKKYDIDLNQKTIFHTKCTSSLCKNPLINKLNYPVIGHKDGGDTKCPGDVLYSQIKKLNKDLQKKEISISEIYKTKAKSNNKKVKAEESSINTNNTVTNNTVTNNTDNNIELLQNFKLILIDYIYIQFYTPEIVQNKINDILQLN